MKGDKKYSNYKACYRNSPGQKLWSKKKKKTFKVEHCEMKVPYKQTQN